MLEPIIDISRWQASNVLYPPVIPFNWDLASRRVYAAFIQCTNGLTLDHQFSYNWITSKNKVARDAYHFFRVSRSLTYPKDQARTFYNYQITCGGLGDMIPWLDVETYDETVTAAEFQNRVLIFLDEFAQLSGKMGIIYTRKGFWDQYVCRPNTSPSRISEMCRLAVANYGASYPVIPWDWEVRYGTDGFEYWQYSADGNGLGRYYGSTGDDDIDLNKFNGTLDEFNLRYNLNVQPLTDPGKDFVICTTSALKIRETPSTLAKVVGYLYLNDMPNALEEKIDSNNIWIRIGWKQWSAMKYGSNIYLEYI